MSVFGAFYSKNNITFVTDTIASQKKPLIKDGKLLPKTFAAITSKTLYFPHFQTAVCSMGLSALSSKLYQFIDQSRSLHDMDSFLKNLHSDFVSFYQKDSEAMSINYSDEKPSWLGVIIIAGASSFQKSNEVENYNGEKCIRLIKAMVWKDKIEFKLMYDVKEEEFNFTFMPRLSDECVNKIIVKDWSADYNNQIEGVLIEHMKELKVNYDNSSRESYMVGGELNLTIMSFQDPSTFVSQRTVYRFQDFWDNIKEVEEFHSRELGL